MHMHYDLVYNDAISIIQMIQDTTIYSVNIFWSLSVVIFWFSSDPFPQLSLVPALLTVITWLWILFSKTQHHIKGDSALLSPGEAGDGSYSFSRSEADGGMTLDCTASPCYYPLQWVCPKASRWIFGYHCFFPLHFPLPSPWHGLWGQSVHGLHWCQGSCTWMQVGLMVNYCTNPWTSNSSWQRGGCNAAEPSPLRGSALRSHLPISTLHLLILWAVGNN